MAARTIVESDHDLRAVVSFTNSGYSAVLMSKAYPGVPIYAISPSEPVVRRLSLSRSVTPLSGPNVRSIEDMFDTVDRMLLEHGLVARGDEVLVTGSVPVRLAGTTNFLKLHVVGETDADGQHK
ncbi:MAG: pyruvate kinase alpha/beta domain-containing protein [Dehalococcoidia bacterium]|nr:pyruvate kinase alpha/beta domain-containing protein [Dehalococcoidia bacterium]